jgi:hypothetical protein
MIGASPNLGITMASNRAVKRLPDSVYDTVICWTPCSGQLTRGDIRFDHGLKLIRVQVPT